MNNKLTLNKLIEKQDLNMDESYDFLMEVMRGNISEIQLSSFLTALRMKSETYEEITGFVKAVRENAKKVNINISYDFLDTCGTGGDGKNSINISTLSGLTLASMGVHVVKHGNRSVSSLCGSSDLLEALGYPFAEPTEESIQSFLQKGFTFLFAPSWHPAMKHAVNVRKELGFRTVFNLIGPLSNPLSPTHQIIGVFSRDLIPIFINVLKELQLKKAIVCHSMDGFDEFSIQVDTEYSYLAFGEIHRKTFSPSGLNIKDFHKNEIFASSKEESIHLSKRIINGEIITGTHQVALNSGVGLFLMDRVNTIEEGYHQALEHISSRSIQKFLEKNGEI